MPSLIGIGIPIPIFFGQFFTLAGIVIDKIYTKKHTLKTLSSCYVTMEMLHDPQLPEEDLSLVERKICKELGIDTLHHFDTEISLLYSALPYHNFQHAQNVLKNALRYCARCDTYAIAYDAIVVYFSALLHDAGYEQSHLELGFSTKEAYSAFLAVQFLSAKGYDHKLITKVQDCILATILEVTPITTEQKIVRAADLADMAKSYEQFFQNSELLKQEYEYLTKKTLTDEEWKQMTKEIIGNYLREQIHLTPEYYDKDHKSVFHTKVQQNLDRYLFSSSTSSSTPT